MSLRKLFDGDNYDESTKKILKLMSLDIADLNPNHKVVLSSELMRELARTIETKYILPPEFDGLLASANESSPILDKEDYLTHLFIEAKTSGKRPYQINSSSFLFQPISSKPNDELEDLDIDELISRTNQPD